MAVILPAPHPHGLPPHGGGCATASPDASHGMQSAGAASFRLPPADPMPMGVRRTGIAIVCMLATTAAVAGACSTADGGSRDSASPGASTAGSSTGLGERTAADTEDSARSEGHGDSGGAVEGAGQPQYSTVSITGKPGSLSFEVTS